MRRAVCILGLIMMGLLLVTAACETTQYEPGGGGTPPTQATQGEGRLEILSHELTWEGEYFRTAYVRGIAKNVGDARLSWAEVDVRFYDSQGNLLETSLDVISDLDPGMTWAFEVIGFDENIADYDIGVGS